jgi:phospholipase/carboxylesterase
MRASPEDERPRRPVSTDLLHQIRPADGDPEGALVLLHGRGVNMFDLLPLGDALDPDRRLVVVTPQAPLELSPGGFHWYVIERVGYPNAETFWQTNALVAAFLDSLPDRIGVPWERTVLGGFSQGAVMTYALGLGEGRPHPAGVLALSGFIPEVDGFALAGDLAGYPVAIGHGTLDPIISVDFGRRARATLDEAGCDVLYRESEMSHTIDPAFLLELRPWLAERVPA